MLWQMGQVAEAAILDPHPGLVGWWRFDEGSGTVAEDSSGYGNHGTIYGATSVDGKYGKALSFDGVDDYVMVPPPFSDVKQNFTWSMWVNLTEVGTHRGLMEFLLGSYRVRTNYQAASVSIVEALTPQTYTAGVNGAPFVLDAWIHWTVVFDYTNLEVRTYKNGAFFASGSIDKAKWDSLGATTNLRIGTGYYCSNWKGEIDEVRIYNRALSAAEIENSQKDPDLSSRILAKVPKGTTQFMVTLSWQGSGSVNATIESPSETYTENIVPVYQKTTYSSSSGDMLNIKRLAVSVTALPNDENWYIILEFDDVEDYKITVEVQT